MATYDMRCNECGNVYEAVGSMATPPSSFPCPDCKSSNVRKIINSVNFQLKGDGWTRKKDVGDWTKKNPEKQS